MQIVRRMTLLVAVVSWGALAACDDSSGPGAGSVSLSLTVPAPAPAARVASPAMFDLVYTDGSSTLTISSVELVMREIELEMVDDDSCADTVEGEDLCEEFETGPRVFPLPMDGSVDAVLSLSDVPPGLYDELEVEIHKVGGDPEDQTILTSRPDLADASLKVVGDVDGDPFAFTSGVEEEFEFPLTPAVDPSAGPINVTISIDVESWFRALDDSLLDPSDEGNRSQIENNIQQSFEVFEDDDGDGEDDHDGGGDS